MTSSELLRRLCGSGHASLPGEEGGHVMMFPGTRKTFVPTGSGELRRGTLHAIFRALGITEDDIR
jgi:hypothetical protein